MPIKHRGDEHVAGEPGRPRRESRDAVDGAASEVVELGHGGSECGTPDWSTWEPPGSTSDRDTVTVTGADAMTYLQSQLSQEIRDLEVGDARWTFLLEPNGRIDVLARVTRVADDTYRLDTDAGFGEALLERVNRFKIRVRADVELTALRPVGPPDDASDSERIEAGWPRMGAEIVAGETIPAETGLNEVAVNFKKGCYPGPGAGRAHGQPGGGGAAVVAPPRRGRRARRPAIRSSTPTATRWACSTTVSGTQGARLREAQLRRRRARHALVRAARSRRSSGSSCSTASSGA